MVNPMYRRIAEDIRSHMERGELRSGAQLPTELELREKHNASRNTIRDAIKWPVEIQRASALLAGELGIKQAGYRDVIMVRAPDETEMAFFTLPDDGRVPVIATRRTAYDDRGKPFRLTLSVSPADRNQFVVKVGVVGTT